MNYYYNEVEQSFAITTNFEYNPVPSGFIKITKERYEELQEKIKQEKGDK